MTASIGIASYPADGDMAEELVRNADTAMYAAKKEGKSCWRFYTATMQTQAYEKMRLTNSLRHALERGGIFVALPTANSFSHWSGGSVWKLLCVGIVLSMERFHR